MTRAEGYSPRKLRPGVVIVVALLHVALVVALVRGFAPEFTAQVADRVFSAVTVTITAPPPKPPSLPAAPSQAAEAAGAAGEAGKRAQAKPVAAPSPRIVLATPAAPPVAGQGSDISSGARDAGSGTGAGGLGSGTGAGGSGNGPGGGGGASKVAKIAGDINATRDYPAASRELRLGDYVIVALTVGIDGRAKGCRVHRPSRDPQADQITCRLATERFRFRPATDGQGNPIESVYGWRQRWFAPSEKN